MDVDDKMDFYDTFRIRMWPYWLDKERARTILRVLDCNRNMDFDELIQYLRTNNKDKTINKILWKEEIDCLQELKWKKPLLIHNDDKDKGWEVVKDHFAYEELYNFPNESSFQNFDIFIDMDDNKGESFTTKRERLKKRFEKYLNENLARGAVYYKKDQEYAIVLPAYLVDADDLELTSYWYDFRVDDKSKIKEFIKDAEDALIMFAECEDKQIKQIPIQIAKMYFLDSIKDNDKNDAVSKMWEIYCQFIGATFFNSNLNSVYLESYEDLELEKLESDEEKLESKRLEKLDFIPDMINEFMRNELLKKYKKLYKEDKQGCPLRDYVEINEKVKGAEIRKCKREKVSKIMKATFYVFFSSFIFALRTGRFLGSRIYFKEKPLDDVFLKGLSESETIEFSVPYDEADDLDFI